MPLDVTAAHQVVFKTADVIHKVKAKIQQAQNSRLPTLFLRGDTVNNNFVFIRESASARGLDPLIKNPSYLFKVDVFYFYKPAKNILKFLYLCYWSIRRIVLQWENTPIFIKKSPGNPIM
jgi:hypothetical protein